MENIFINRGKWKSFSESEMLSYVKSVFDYYRKNGFPYFKNDIEFRKKEFNTLVGYDFKRVIDKENKIIKQSMHGLSLAWSYMPHSWEVKCGNMKTPFEVFFNDEEFIKVINKRIKMGDNISDNGIRKMLKIFTGTQSVSNFRPTAAAAIYSLFCNEGDTVWDMSCGYGGRLLGATLAKVNYIGTDPATPTYNGLIELSNDFSKDIKVELNKLGSEDYKPKNNSLDFAFTSPPYFNWEKYTNEETQSYLKYKTKEEWINGYLKKTFINCFNGLKDNKIMAINIANIKNFTNLEDEAIRVAKEAGFVHEDTWKLALSNSKMKGKIESFKYEPIFIFRKVS